MSNLFNFTILISPFLLAALYFTDFKNLGDIVLYLTIVFSLIRILIPIRFELILKLLIGFCFFDLLGQLFYICENGLSDFSIDSYKKASFIFNDSNYAAYFLLYVFLFTQDKIIRMLSCVMIIFTGSIAAYFSLFIFFFLIGKVYLSIYFWGLSFLLGFIFLDAEHVVQFWKFVIDKFESKIFILNFEVDYLLNSSVHQNLFGDGIDSNVAANTQFPLRHTFLGYLSEVGLFGVFLLVASYSKTIPTRFYDLRSIILFANAIISFVPISFLLPLTLLVRKRAT